MRVCACPICGKIDCCVFYWDAYGTFVADCPEHGVNVALATPIEIEEE